MNLSFKTKFEDGSQTHFVEKIWAGLPSTCMDESFVLEHERPYCDLAEIKGLELLNNQRPKFHSIRDTHRWDVDMLIHFYIYSRQPDMFRFAPIIPVKSIQTITIEWKKSQTFGLMFHRKRPFERESGYYPDVVIDYQHNLNEEEIELLARNDGFENAAAFLKWFKDGIIDNKIIHWNNIVYG